MKKIFVLFSSAAFLFSTVILSCEMNAKKGASEPISKDSLIKRGEYLVLIAGCDDCHTPKKMGPNGPEFDMDKRLSGYRMEVPFPSLDSNLIKNGWVLTNMELTGWAGPWGASFTANITSDETGIGNWSEEQFKKAFQQGKWKGMDGNRSLMPPMPWQNYTHMKEEDVKAIFAFLKSTKPINNIEPPIKAFADLK